MTYGLITVYEEIHAQPGNARPKLLIEEGHFASGTRATSVRDDQLREVMRKARDWGLASQVRVRRTKFGHGEDHAGIWETTGDSNILILVED